MTRTSSGFMLKTPQTYLLHVLHALGLVVDRELAARLEHDRRGIELHRVVMLDRRVIVGLVTDCGRGERLIGLAARLRRRQRAFLGLDRRRLVALTKDVRDEVFGRVFDLHQRRGMARDLRCFGDDQRDRLAVEHDLAVVERPVRRSVLRCHVVLVGLILVRHRRTVLVRQHGEHALDALWRRCRRCA